MAKVTTNHCTTNIRLLFLNYYYLHYNYHLLVTHKCTLADTILDNHIMREKKKTNKLKPMERKATSKATESHVFLDC